MTPKIDAVDPVDGIVAGGPRATDSSRRDFVKTLAYVTPTILTLQTQPAYASPGSLKGNPPDGCVGGPRYCPDGVKGTR